MQSNRTHYCLNLIGLLIFLCAVALHVDAQTNGNENAQATLIRDRVHKIMRQTIERGETMITDGRQVVARTLIPPSNFDIDEVKGYGNKAVPILAEYLRQPSGFEK